MLWGEQLLTADEVAALFRVHVKTVGRWAVKEQIRSIKTPGGQRRYPKSQIMALLEGSG